MKTRAAILTIILALLLAAWAAPPAGALTSGDYEYTVDVTGAATITGYNGSAPNLTIPDTLNSHPVTAIGSGAFSGNGTLVSVVIPDGVLEIEGYAFEYCMALEHVIIAAEVESLGANPFYGCFGLRSIEVSPGNRTLEVVDRPLFFIPDKRLIAYPAASPGSGYIIPDGTEIIGAYAFNGCLLFSVNIPDSVKYVAGSAFYYCELLVYVEIGRGIERVDANPFVGCEYLFYMSVAPDHGLLEIVDRMLISKPDMRLISCPTGPSTERREVPDGVISIGDSAFFNCDKLKEIILPGSVTEIGYGAFAYASALVSVNIPDGVTSIGESAFHDCASLAALALPESVTYIDGEAFYGCTALTLKVHPGSHAAEYAEAAGIPYEYAGAGGWHFDHNNPRNDHSGGPAHRGR